MNKILLLLLAFYIGHANAQLCFSLPDSFAVGTSPSSITNADFNGDGKKDLAVGYRSSSNVSILLGTGTGSFGTATNFAIGGNGYSVISSDFNGDGKADLATA